MKLKNPNLIGPRLQDGRFRSKTAVPGYWKAWHRKNKEQWNVYAREWRKRNPHKVKDYRLRQDYGISLTEYNEMWVRQGKKCAICGISVGKMFVDHDHETGQVRGILCITCNIGLGGFKDNPEFLMSAIAYLR